MAKKSRGNTRNRWVATANRCTDDTHRRPSTSLWYRLLAPVSHFHYLLPLGRMGSSALTGVAHRVPFNPHPSHDFCPHPGPRMIRSPPPRSPSQGMVRWGVRSRMPSKPRRSPSARTTEAVQSGCDAPGGVPSTRGGSAVSGIRHRASPSARGCPIRRRDFRTIPERRRVWAGHSDHSPRPFPSLVVQKST